MNPPKNLTPEPEHLPDSLEEWIDRKDVEDLMKDTGVTPAGLCFNKDMTDPRDRWDFSETELRSTFG